MIDANIGFTSDVIRDPKRFVGRSDLIRDCIRALSADHGLLVVYGKRGVGKSSLLRQIQQVGTGDFTLPKNAGASHLIPERPRNYLTTYYQCDSRIRDCDHLLQRMLNDQDPEDGLLRLVPDDGKELTEFTRSKGAEVGADLKVVKWGSKGIETSKYARPVDGDVVQTFRNYVTSIVTHQLRAHAKDGLLILIDEFDVIQDKTGIGSLVKSLSSREVRFGLCGIADDVASLVHDHASVERLLEEGALHLRPMSPSESTEIINRAEALFKEELLFDSDVKVTIADISHGYPYLVQLLGRACVNQANELGETQVNMHVLDLVMESIRSGKAFPNLEAKYQRAVGSSQQRQLLLHLMADEPPEDEAVDVEAGSIKLKNIRGTAQELEVDNLDQVIPRLIDKKYGPTLNKVRQGVYEFVDPVLRIYVTLRRM